MIEGSLHNLPFGDVLQVIATGQKSGVLEVSRSQVQARLAFDRGGLAYAQLVPGLHLGELLVRMDLLTAREVQYLLARQRHRDDAARLGTLACEAGLLEPEELQRAVRAQVLDALSELCGWKSGAFRFSDAGLGRGPRLEPALDTLSLLMEVVQQLDDWGKGRVSSEAVFARCGDPSHQSLPEGGWDVLGYVNGRRCAASIAAELDLSERQVYRVLYVLESLGVIQAATHPGEVPTVLVLAGDYRLQRLLHLSVRRAGLRPHLAADAASGLAYLRREHPRAVVVDDDAGEGWAFVRELRALARRSHLPTVVLDGGAPQSRFGIGFGSKRPQAHRLPKPFAELELQQLLTRLVGRALA